MIERIVSGGQTGADRGGLDAAIETGVPHMGYCPRDRRAENGRIPDRYELISTRSPGYRTRTAMNVRVSDATLAFVVGPETPGTRLTREICARKPFLLIDLDATDEGSAVVEILRWLAWNRVRILNIAGSRESRAPGIQDRVRRVVTRVITEQRIRQNEETRGEDLTQETGLDTLVE